MAAARIRSERCGPWLEKVSSNDRGTREPRLCGPEAGVFLSGDREPGDPSSGHIRDRASRFSIGCTWPRAWEVPGTRVTSLEGFSKALRVGFESEGPTLIEVPL
jgi:hypothetical protein